MEEKEKISFGESFKTAKGYVDSQIELLKLRATARASRIIGALIIDVAKILFSLFVVFFLSMSLGFYLSEVFGSHSLGFLVTAGIFVVVIVLLKLFKKPLEALFMNTTIRKVLGKWGEEDDHMEEERLARMKKRVRKTEKQTEELKDEIENIENSNEQQ